MTPHHPNFWPDKLDAPITLDGPVGQIEALTTVPTTPAKPYFAVICHPHPLHQGTMNNKVVHTLSRAYHRQNIPTVRFNYRGVGKSEGSYGDYVGEIEDLLAVVHWAEGIFPTHSPLLAGFSFGSFVATSAANQLSGAKHLITVAPAVNHKSFEEFTELTLPWLIIQGSDDDLVPKEEVEAFSKTLSQAGHIYQSIQNADHFFHGKLIELREIAEAFISKHT